jgi:hypothetical protein
MTYARRSSLSSATNRLGAAMAGDQVRVSRSLYLSALDDAIDWQASLLASQRHSPEYPGGPSCCAPGARCETYRETAGLLARYRKARAAVTRVGKKPAGTP